MSIFDDREAWRGPFRVVKRPPAPAPTVADNGFHRPDINSVSSFERVQAAQARRVTQAMRLSDAEILAALCNMPASRAMPLLQQALSETIARAMQAAHEREV